MEMQHAKDVHQLLSSEGVRERPLRDRVGVNVIYRDTLDAITRIREAERAGVQQVWIQGTNALITLAVVATQTERIRLGTAIVAIYSRHPLEMAREALVVHDLAPGRLRLGIGPGDRVVVEQLYGLSQISPLAYLKEYLEVVRGVLWEGNLEYHGTFFNMSKDNAAAASVAAKLRQAQVPLLISAVGLKAFRLAGEIADGALPWVSPVPYLLESALPELRAGAEIRSRPAPPVIAYVQVALSPDEAKVQVATRKLARRSMQSVFYTRMFAKAGFAKAVEGDEAALDALARALVISGDETTVYERIQELLASGLDELLLHLVPIADEENERKQLLHLVGSL
jgi:alkanesulfonate monooxygenase SsuD/methylene tetrahydromethanopterin reductase-like flavin-dependent oxidoreductase (luciferase family)